MYDEEQDKPQNQEVNAHPLPDSVPQKEQIASGSTSRFGGSVQSQAPTNKTGVYEVKSTSVGKPISVGKVLPFVGKKIPKAGAGNAVNIRVTTSTAGNRNTDTTQDVPLATGEATSTFIELPSNAGANTSITVQGMSAAPVHVNIYSVNSYDEEVYDALGPTN